MSGTNAAAAGEGCSDVGLVQILGHGVPRAAVAGLASATDDFFALPLEDAVREAARVVASEG